MLYTSSHPHTRSQAARAAPASSPRAPGLDEWQALLVERPSVSVLEALNRSLRLRWVDRGELVFSRSQRARDLVAVLEGAVGLGQRGEDASFDLQRSASGPQWLDLSSAWLGGGHGQDAVALSRALLLELPVVQMRELLPAEPELGELLIAGLARAVRKLASMSHDLVHKDAEHRLAEWLLRRCLPAGEELIVPLSERKRDVAAQLGITPETFSRSLKQLSAKKLIEVQGYTIKVLDLQALRRVTGTA
jgi:CRP-like cAMP-binding protein